MTRFTFIAILSEHSTKMLLHSIFIHAFKRVLSLFGHKHHIESREIQKTPFTIVADKNSFKFSNFGELDLHYEASTDRSVQHSNRKYYKQYTVRYTDDDRSRSEAWQRWLLVLAFDLFWWRPVDGPNQNCQREVYPHETVNHLAFLTVRYFE